MRTFPFLLSLLFFTSLFSNCKNKPSPIQKEKAEADLPKDFLDFYQKFHTDSAYQIAHIEWPLRGESGSVDTTHNRQLAEWLPENWRIMTLPDTTMSTLKRNYEMVGEVLVIERLFYPMVGYGYERQFFKDEQNEWKLIYYGETQQMQ